MVPIHHSPIALPSDGIRLLKRAAPRNNAQKKQQQLHSEQSVRITAAFIVTLSQRGRDKWILKGSDDGVLASWTLSIVRYSRNWKTRTFRKLDLFVA
jgi:hypothetical protein